MEADYPRLDVRASSGHQASDHASIGLAPDSGDPESLLFHHLPAQGQITGYVDPQINLGYKSVKISRPWGCVCSRTQKRFFAKAQELAGRMTAGGSRSSASRCECLLGKDDAKLGFLLCEAAGSARAISTNRRLKRVVLCTLLRRSGHHHDRGCRDAQITTVRHSSASNYDDMRLRGGQI